MDAFSEEDVAAFAHLSGATGQVHLDHDAARQAGFGGVLVHGLMLLGLLDRALTAAYADQGAWVSEAAVRYLRPVIAGEPVRTEVRVAEPAPASEPPVILHEVRCLNERDEPVLVGEITVAGTLGAAPAAPAGGAPGASLAPVSTPLADASFVSLTAGLTGPPTQYEVTNTFLEILAAALHQGASPGSASGGSRTAAWLLFGFVGPFYRSVQAVIPPPWPPNRIHARHRFQVDTPVSAGDHVTAQAEIVQTEVRRGRNLVTFRTTSYVAGRRAARFEHVEVWP